RVDAHGIDVLDRADDDDVVGAVAYHLELELLPADDAAVDQNFIDRREVDAATHRDLELVRVVRDAAARPAERERRPDDRGIAGIANDPQRLVVRPREAAVRDLEAEPRHGGAELLAILRHADRTCVGADQLDTMLLEYAGVIELERDV